MRNLVVIKGHGEGADEVTARRNCKVDIVEKLYQQNWIPSAEKLLPDITKETFLKWRFSMLESARLQTLLKKRSREQ